MNNSYFSRILAGLLVVATSVTVASCKKEQLPDPNFPAPLAEIVLGENGTHSLEFTPNYDWELKLESASKEDLSWFWLLDGNTKVYSVRGKANTPVNVTVCTNDLSDFDLVHKCKLSLVMNGIEKEIASFSRNTKAREISLAVCRMDGGDFAYGSGDGTIYSYEQPVAVGASVPFLWNERMGTYGRAILVKANFDWNIVDCPDWVSDIKGTSGKSGEAVEITLDADASKFPIKGTKNTLTFAASAKLSAEFKYEIAVPVINPAAPVSFANVAVFEALASNYGANSQFGVKESYRIVQTSGSWSDDNADLFLRPTREIVSCRYYDMEGDEMSADASWLEYFEYPDATEETQGLFKFKMSPEKDEYAGQHESYKNLGFAVLYDANGPCALVELAYNVENIVSNEELSFVNPDAVEGAHLVKLSAGNIVELKNKYKAFDFANKLLDESLETGITTFFLTYTSAEPKNTTLRLSFKPAIPEDPVYVLQQPDWFSYEASTQNGVTQVTFIMNKPGEDESKYAKVQIFKPGWSATDLVDLYCIPEF